jgi:phospholipid/cholesterol/gamma-HCH transport system substrate-binding protein
MKSFAERSPLVVGAIGIAVTAGIVVAALQYNNLPFFSGGNKYAAYFAEAGGLQSGAAVQVSGFRVGQVSSVGLDGNKVLIKFDVAKNIRLGERTEAAIKTKSLLGAKILEVTPRGDGRLDGPIPVSRTTSPYQLPDALGDLTATISGLNTSQLSDALQTLAQTFRDTPPEVKVAVQGVAEFSKTLDERDAQLRNLLANANKVTDVLSQRADQVVSLIANSNALLAQLQTQSRALDRISGNISALSNQLSGFVGDNRAQLRPALDKLNGVLTILDDHKKQIQDVLNKFPKYIMALGETVSSGPFFKAYLANLVPGQFIQPFIDAAFSDLGLDPNVLLPSQRTDPQTGQAGAPPLPVPYPRTGQGGEPNLTLPDAITGNPGDPRYPYRQPLPAPPPAGPPPGPPAGYTPTPVPSAPVTAGPGMPGPARVTVVPLPPPSANPGPGPSSGGPPPTTGEPGARQ